MLVYKSRVQILQWYWTQWGYEPSCCGCGRQNRYDRKGGRLWQRPWDIEQVSGGWNWSIALAWSWRIASSWDCRDDLDDFCREIRSRDPWASRWNNRLIAAGNSNRCRSRLVQSEQKLVGKSHDDRCRTLKNNVYIQKADQSLALYRICKIYHILPSGSQGPGLRRLGYCYIFLHNMRHRHMMAQSISVRVGRSFQGRRSQYTERYKTVHWYIRLVCICNRCRILHRTCIFVPEDRLGECCRRYPAAWYLLRTSLENSTEVDCHWRTLDKDWLCIEPGVFLSRRSPWASGATEQKSRFSASRLRLRTSQSEQ